jgi:cytochrome oxidase assembly protein ShyY1
VLNLTNNHLQYALTWFALAIVLAAVTFAYVRGEQRRPSDLHR